MDGSNLSRARDERLNICFVLNNLPLWSIRTSQVDVVITYNQVFEWIKLNKGKLTDISLFMLDASTGDLRKGICSTISNNS